MAMAKRKNNNKIISVQHSLSLAWIILCLSNTQRYAAFLLWMNIGLLLFLCFFFITTKLLNFGEINFLGMLGSSEWTQRKSFSSNREGLYYPIIHIIRLWTWICMDLIVIVREYYHIFVCWNIIWNILWNWFKVLMINFHGWFNPQYTT